MTNPRLYTDLAEWWPLLSAPADYEEEAEIYGRLLAEASQRPPVTLIELGSGGGNNASHLRSRFTLTLVEPSEGMLAHSRRLNPECEHVQGDMRTVRLGREFDAVFVHDAVCYMTTEEDLRRAIATAFVHCRPGGVALFAPDHLKETFADGTDHGGHNGDGRSLRYLEWTWDPDPADSTYTVDYAYLLREQDGRCRPSTIGTSKGSSRASSGSTGWQMPGFVRVPSRSSIPSWSPAPTSCSSASGRSEHSTPARANPPGCRARR